MLILNTKALTVLMIHTTSRPASFSGKISSGIKTVAGVATVFSKNERVSLVSSGVGGHFWRTEIWRKYFLKKWDDLQTVIIVFLIITFFWKQWNHEMSFSQYLLFEKENCWPSEWSLIPLFSQVPSCFAYMTVTKPGWIISFILCVNNG